MKKPVVSDLLIPVFLSLVVLLISSLIARSLEHLTVRQILLGAAATACVFLTLSAFTLWFQSNSHRSELENVLAHLRGLIPPSDFEWLYSDAELAKVESESVGDNIWIVSPDLINVTDKAEIIDAVKKNVRRRITYTYIVPDASYIKGVLPGLQQLFKSHPNQLRLVWVPEAEFFLRSITHYAIFNVNRKDGIASEAYLELPIVDSSGKKIRGYWIKVSKDATASLIGRFLEVVEKYSSS